MTSKQTILEKLRDFLQENMEIAKEDVVLESRLYEDLDLDSIDAVDIVVHLQKLTGMKISPAEFKSARTVEDVVDCVHGLISQQ